MGYAPRLALGRRWVNKVSTKRLWGSLLHKDLLLVLLNDLVIMFVHGHELYQLMIYMHEMMMQHLVMQQQQLMIYIARYSYSPYLVEKVVFGISCGLILIR